MTRFGFEPIYDSWWVAAAIVVAIVAVMALVTPPAADPRHRRWLIAIRSVAAILLALVALGPSRIRTDNRPSEATLAVAIDTSRSMTLPDGDGGIRWSTQHDLWRSLADAIIDLDEFLRVVLIEYDEDAREISGPSAASLDDREPEGNRTDLGAALMTSIRSAQGTPLAGVVLIGDGTDTSAAGGIDPQRVAQTLNSMGVPLWGVPIGPASDSSEARDVAVDGLPETMQLFSGNEVEVSLEVRARGFAGVELPVRWSWIDAEGRAEEAAVRRVTPRRASDTQVTTAPLIVPAPGVYRLVAEVEPQTGELIAENNRQTSFVEVREGGGRVLYLEGTPRLEQLFLRRGLQGFSDLEITYQWIPEDTADRWPVDLGNWLRGDRFDIYVLGDLHADALGTEQLQAIAEAVGEGAGLVTLGGFRSYDAGGYGDSPLAKVLPIQVDPGRRRPPTVPREELPEPIAGPLVAIPPRPHPVTNLGDDGSARRWRDLPPLSGANRFAGIKTLPGVQVLLESEAGEPLLVIGEYGRGRVIASAIDSTYRWWREGEQDAHRRFWRQLLLWSVAREDSGRGQIRVEMDARRFEPAARPRFRATVSVMESDEPIPLAAEIFDEQGVPRDVPLDRLTGADSNEQQSEGEVPTLEAGFYRLRVSDSREGRSVEPAEIAFQVIDDSREFERPEADPAYLAQLAEITADHGGGVFGPEQIEALIDEIRQRRRRGETPVISRSRLGDGPGSGWLVFVLFATALAGEWWLRRRWGLA